MLSILHSKLSAHPVTEDKKTTLWMSPCMKDIYIPLETTWNMSTKLLMEINILNP